MRKIIVIFSLLTVVIFLSSYIDADVSSGYLGSTDEFDEIMVNTDETPVYAVFTWDQEVDLWVLVLGEDGRELGNLRMKEANAVKLKNTGKFTLQVYSKKGTGCWFAKYMNEEEYSRSGRK